MVIAGFSILQAGFILLIWLVSAVAGFEFLRAAFRERRTNSGSRLKAAAEEIRFRLRLAAGLILLLFVASGLVWLIANWGKIGIGG